MTEKTQIFDSQEEWLEWRMRYGKSTRYHKYYVNEPSGYPCIGIEETESSGELGTVSTVEVYVYLADFVKSP